MLGLGSAVAQVIWEDDFALARYPNDATWDARMGVYYLAFLVSMLVVGLYGWRASRNRGEHESQRQ